VSVTAAETTAQPLQKSSHQQLQTQLAEPAQLNALTTPLHISQAIAPGSADLLEAVEETEASNLDQVTSVSQLTDVKPTDWAFQALQSLVERYGCIVGYPDRTFRGNQYLTRYEFAAGLNACLDKVQELIKSNTGGFATQADLDAIKKLQEEFAAELATLRGRVDSLEARTATLEKQQFSTTTKLQGLVWFNLTGATANRDVTYEAATAAPADLRFAGGRDAQGNPIRQVASDPEITFSFLTWLTFNTSFTGKDLLVTQLASGNGISPANQFASAGFFNSFGAPFTDQTGGTVNGIPDVVIHDLFYSFPLNDDIRITIGPRINWYRHFDFSRFTFFLTGASSFDSIGSTQTNTVDRGSGAVVEWNIGKKFRFAAAYLGENTEFLPAAFGFNTSSNPRFGLFGGTYTATAELSFTPTESIALRAMYNYSRIQAYGGQVGGAIGEPIPYGYLDDGVSGGGLTHATASAFAFNAEWLITKTIGIFGRYSFATTELKPINQDVKSQSFQIGLGFQDLGKKGALGVITFLMPMDITRGRRFFVAGGGDGGTMYELEVSYFYPVNQNLAIVPAFYAIFNPNNFDSNPTIFVGNLRTQFSF
jgi:hypothetical protein